MARKKATEASLEELQAFYDAENLKITKLRAEMAPLQASLQAAAARRDMYRDSIAKLRKDDLAFIIKDHLAHDQWQKLLPKQAYGSGYWPDTQEQAWKLMLQYMAEPQQELLDFIEEWLKHAEHKVIEVFRHDCGEDGSWVVERKDDKWIIYDARSYHYECTGTPEAEFADTADMVRYISANHYYGGGPNRERYDD